ncbi:hypothetical protein TTHERM_000131369 (macronuclear) [Tetrahymena thermophila SB210]|uniref:Kinase domain protein n=1 Tax=Tetrahymena thermophila (strain SB210) TaxID=312017 RepID=W7XAR3_TETTS|nr:hypothetical protein TTHERM_000131369 [Tetrahymena thermophila SB210]EWS73508.1 hypothetical protein TTHERM_000131369 [Tetrahymena thermophila SB210]|eukprot:XP_012653990.1 hypothetical protein TTHERM_000131369 [Tetrahymena thermophila SB210]
MGNCLFQKSGGFTNWLKFRRLKFMRQYLIVMNNQKLDFKSGEKNLVSVMKKFRKVKIFDLDLKYYCLEENSVSFFFKQLAQYKSLEQIKLILAVNLISYSGAMCIAQNVQQLQNLIIFEIDFEANHIGFNEIKTLARSLSNSKHLQYVNLNYRYNRISYDDIERKITLKNEFMKKNLRLVVLKIIF